MDNNITGYTYSNSGGSTSTYYAIICPYCGSSHHPEACWKVKSIEYYPNGRIKKVELHSHEFNLDPPFKTSITFTGYEEVG